MYIRYKEELYQSYKFANYMVKIKFGASISSPPADRGQPYTRREISICSAGVIGYRGSTLTQRQQMADKDRCEAI